MGGVRYRKSGTEGVCDEVMRGREEQQRSACGEESDVKWCATAVQSVRGRSDVTVPVQLCT